MVYKVGLPKSKKLMDQKIREQKEAADRIRRQVEAKQNKPDGREGCESSR